MATGATDIKLGRGWTAYIYTGGQYIEIKGLTERMLKLSSSEADITTNIDTTYSRHLIARRDAELTLKGFRVEDSDGDWDEGQAAVEALAESVDSASIGQFKLTSPGGVTEREFYGSATMDELGGSIDEGSAWGCTIKQSGDLISGPGA
jgi:hypothetical protein